MPILQNETLGHYKKCAEKTQPHAFCVPSLFCSLGMGRENYRQVLTIKKGTKYTREQSG